MHNLKDIRKNIDTYKKKFKDRNVDFNISDFNEKDKLNRDLISKKEKLEQEKKIISNLCCTGLYYFREIKLFKNAFEKYSKDQHLQEYYVAPLYNYLISDGLSIHYHKIPKTEVFFSGTPEEYKRILKVWGE